MFSFFMGVYIDVTNMTEYNKSSEKFNNSKQKKERWLCKSERR